MNQASLKYISFKLNISFKGKLPLPFTLSTLAGVLCVAARGSSRACVMTWREVRLGQLTSDRRTAKLCPIFFFNMAPIITESQVLFSHVRLKLATLYLEESENKRDTRRCEEIFADFGLQVDQSNPKSRQNFVMLVLHYQRLVKKYKTAKKNIRSDKEAIESITKKRNEVFYSPEKHKDLVFVQPAVHM